MSTITKGDLLKKWQNMPDDAEIRIAPDWVNDFDYMSIEDTGYLKEFNLIILQPRYD